MLDQVVEVRDVQLLQCFAVEGLDGDRYVLRIFSAPLRGNDDFLYRSGASSGLSTGWLIGGRPDTGLGTENRRDCTRNLLIRSQLRAPQVVPSAALACGRSAFGEIARRGRF